VAYYSLIVAPSSAGLDQQRLERANDCLMQGYPGSYHRREVLPGLQDPIQLDMESLTVHLSRGSDALPSLPSSEQP